MPASGPSAPDGPEPNPAEPDSAEPDAVEPDAAEPGMALPHLVEPDSADPDAVEPDEEVPGIAHLSAIAVFAAVLLGVGVLFGLVFLAMGVPGCEAPDVDWIPCIAP